MARRNDLVASPRLREETLLIENVRVAVLWWLRHSREKTLLNFASLTDGSMNFAHINKPLLVCLFFTMNKKNPFDVRKTPSLNRFHEEICDENLYFYSLMPHNSR